MAFETRGCCDWPASRLPGAQVDKTRPAVVLSNEEYQRSRPDVILGLITTQPPNPMGPTDCELRDWRQAGLHSHCYFRLFLATVRQASVRSVGRLSQSDWESVRRCQQAGLGE